MTSQNYDAISMSLSVKAVLSVKFGINDVTYALVIAKLNSNKGSTTIHKVLNEPKAYECDGL